MTKPTLKVVPQQVRLNRAFIYGIFTALGILTTSFAAVAGRNSNMADESVRQATEAQKAVLKQKAHTDVMDERFIWILKELHEIKTELKALRSAEK